MGVDKATITLGGTTLLARAVAHRDEVCDPVLIAPGDTATTLDGRQSVTDAVRDAGPLGGVVAALRASPHLLLTVVAVDLPWIDPRLLQLLAGVIGDADVAVCETAGGVEPLHAVYATSILEEAEAALAGPDRSLRGLIARVKARRVPESEWRAAGISERFARNLNTPEDVAAVSPETLR